MPENLPKKCRGMVIQDNFSVFKYEYVSSLLYQFGLLHFISHCLLCVVSAKITSTVKFDTYKNTHFLLTHF